MGNLLHRTLRIEPGEGRAVTAGFAYAFLLLFGYGILRPVREAWGIEGGTERLPWLFSATFATMLVAIPFYTWLVGRVTGARLVPIVHGFFALHLLAFAWALAEGVALPSVGAVYFVWVSVFNLFVVALFWSLMADVFRPGQARRLFPVVAAGASLGAIAGPAATSGLARWLGLPGLLLVTAGALLACALAAAWLPTPARPEAPPAGSGDEGAGPGLRPRALRAEPPVRLLDGLRLVWRERYLRGLAAQILALTGTATLLYFAQAELVSTASERLEDRTALFARIDLAVNVVQVALQLFVTERFVRLGGLAAVLRALPAVTALGALALLAAPTLLVLTAAQAVRRAVQYAVYRPGREMLFTVVPRTQKYASKGAIDTVVYRGGDFAFGWGAELLGTLGSKVAVLAAACLPLAAGWWWLSGWLAARHERIEQGLDPDTPPAAPLAPVRVPTKGSAR